MDNSNVPEQQFGLRSIYGTTERKFDTRKLPEDIRRVHDNLLNLKQYPPSVTPEEYALLFVFVMRTAVELHRAWHMTLLTSNILQQVKEKFGLHCTWNLGVIRLKFRVEDGGYELQ